MQQIVELDLEPSSEIDPLEANAQVVDWLFKTSDNCLALDFNLSITSKIRNDYRPRLTTKYSYQQDRSWILKSSIKGFLSFIICDQGVEEIKAMYIDGFPGYFVSDMYSDSSSLPVEESMVLYVTKFSKTLLFAKTLLLFAHDGYPVFIWKVNSG